MEKRKVFIFALLGVLAFFVVLYFFFFAKDEGVEQDVPLQVAIGNLTTSRLFEIQDTELVDVTFIPEGSILSRFRNHNIRATVSVILPPNRLGNVLVFENESGTKQLLSESSVKDAASLSNDGTKVAYSELNLPFGSTLHSEIVSNWVVKTIDVATGEITEVGEGYGPFFASNTSDVLFYSTTEGVVQHNLITDEKELMYGVLFPDITKTAKFSPNGLYMATFNPLTQAFTVFSIIGEYPYSVSAVGEPAPRFETVIISNTELFGVLFNGDTEERELRVVTLDSENGDIKTASTQGRTIFTFEPGVVPYQIIP